MERMKERDWWLSPIDWVGVVLLIIGGLNWGFIGLFNFNLVAAIFGNATFLSRLIYTIVGLSALWSIIALATHLHQRSFETHETPGAMAH